MEVTFYNVTISLVAKNPQAAYDELCDLLGKHADIEWTTQTFTVTQEDGTTTSEARSTEELFPLF